MKKFKDIWGKLAGKGYYIALAACALVIGISGILYFTVGKSEPQLQDAGATYDQDIPVMGTDPLPTDPTKPLKTGLPVEGKMVLGHSMDRLTYDPTTRDWRTHNGIDIAAEAGTPVCAAADGVVYTTYTDPAMGTTVVIRHGEGFVTTYSSLDGELAVSAGDEVKLGQTIGKVGTSAMMETALGDHVHFSVTLNDQPMDPEDLFDLA